MLTSAQGWEIFHGTILTIEIALVALFFGVVLGIIVALGRISHNKVAKAITWFYVWFFRGTPLLLQLFMIYFAVPIIYLNVTGSTLVVDPMLCAFITFSLNSTAYMAEIIRAAIESIPEGQMEAAKALGMNYHQAMRKIIIPQTFKRLVAPLGNELIMLLKDTSLVSTIALFDVLRTVKTMATSTGNWVYYLYAAAIYLFLTTILQVLFDHLEKRFGAYEKR
ncbi:amino acid ABC transporter permease [uncultured Pseudoramibacter sp.]|uniref:Amino acid ABC transporter permease n=1 Tax=Candidatus Pseudoramibacter fermentans TaxID=2594427 RepID=A0A6L5GRM7_9FIRM|nr:amino acid ABC transporter permease [uncultured Pseudoramibacter sp.]MQM72875.1 amino acid ABC transporter permease [Candidatus Pseudoramibacter fermentans]RRF93774.1 MAG: amino acid ABC transporter permease [Eubacteriaceae bacterium]